MGPTSVKWYAWAVGILMLVIVLAPWWRNHVYLRSFFDYGVVMGGSGRIDDGQRPYVDFITPIQTGWYGLNRLAEKAGGGTFQAMTLSGAVCTLASFAVLWWMLARRWPAVLSALLAGALVAATAAQHTILFYNSWGVVLVAVAAWAGAVAPVLRKTDWPWHALAGAALFFGGINKINMQLMALGLACAWAVRAGLAGRAGAVRVGATLLYYVAWAVLPVLAEMAWTGASFATWWHNVIALPAANRSGMVGAAVSKDFFLKSLHDYYGPLLLPQGGLLGAGATGLTVAAILHKTWREAGWLEKILPVGCGAAAFLGGAVFLTTNMDIIYIGVAGWLALVIALWLGYELPARGAWFYGAVVGPVLLVGVCAWHSAWQGQRSQFGHSSAPRSAYVDGARAGADFAYLRGTRLPPEIVESLQAMGDWRRTLSAERRRKHFFGPGTEWAARFWPAPRTPGLPIYVHAGNSMGPTEAVALFSMVSSGEFQEITVSRVLDNWPEREAIYLEHRYDKHSVGEIYSVYSLGVNSGTSGAPVAFTRRFGGNADSRFLISDAQLLSRGIWHMFLGVTEGTSVMQLTAVSNRLQGEVVLRRAEGAPRVPVSAHFMIYAQANPTTRFERWSQQVELPADQDEILVPYAIDSSHFPTTFTVEIPPALKGIAAAGWRGPRIQHTGGDGPDKPAWFFRTGAPVTPMDEAMLARLLPDGWRPEAAFMRNGRVNESGIELSAAGEIWLRVKGLVTEFAGTAVMPPGGQPPFVRGMWYSGGRLEVFSEMPVRPDDRTADFHAWCAEPGGWLVIAVDPAMGVTPVTVRVHKVTHKNFP